MGGIRKRQGYNFQFFSSCGLRGRILTNFYVIIGKIMWIRDSHKEFAKARTVEDRIADKITEFAGSMKFVYAHFLWFVLWPILNLGLFGIGFVFDEYPFGLLTMIVSLEAIFLSTFVMISQNRQAKASEIRSQLDFETDVKAEKEIEIIMETLRRIAQKTGVKIDDLVQEIQKLHREEELLKKEKFLS